MGQVPVSYFIIGDGCVARHFKHYFDLEGVAYSSWARRGGSPLPLEIPKSATHVLFLISDHAIESFYRENPQLHSRICVHFAGSLWSQTLIGLHPLMTFAKDSRYELATYREIPFVAERGRNSALPGLSNKIYEIESTQKERYHALCALSGNMTVLLWEKVFREFSLQFGLPKEILTPYLMQIAHNLAHSKQNETVLTGPLARKDQATVQKHLQSLMNDPYGAVYSAFVSAYETERTNK